MAAMLRQQALIDIRQWEPDPQFAIFPQGARAKDAVFSPVHPADACLTPKKRYLFKKSKKSYPDQFWGEIIAYRIGCAIGVPVPPAFVACNGDTGMCGALIEWFYEDAEEISLHAGDLLTRIQPDFDRQKGTAHNLRDASTLMRGLLGSRGIDRMGVSWRQWWANALFFDALIGNTDRHQDNWVLLLTRRFNVDPQKRVRIGPCFDNGTSLGHERFPQRVAAWRDADFIRYIDKGRHHVKWSLDEPERGHFALLERAWAAWPETRAQCRAIAAELNIERLEAVLSDLADLQCPVPLLPERRIFLLTLLHHRIERLKALLLT